MGRALLRLKPSRIWESMGDYERYGGPHTPVNALAGAAACRARVRLKPSRMWESMGHYVRYAVPQHCVNALAGVFICRDRDSPYK
jgi:hypothetical protein